MSLKDLKLKHVYFSDEDNLLEDFYIPVLSNSIMYKRIAGYFCSNAFAISAKGIASFIKNNGRIQLIANILLSSEDQEEIKKALFNKEQEVLIEINNLEDHLKKNHIRIFGWMIKNNLIEIKIAVVKNGLEHRKMGTFQDLEGNQIAFSGSDNETVKGWLHNDEQFHVFCSWIDGDKKHLLPEIENFDRLWENKGKKVILYDVSEAFKNGLIKNAPQDDAEFKRLSEEVTEELLEKNALFYTKKIDDKVTLRGYQSEAIKKWTENDYKGIFEMATGTGKTFTALGCIDKLTKNNKKTTTIISVPYQHLVQQWKKEIDKYGISYDFIIIADSSNSKWKDEIVNNFLDTSLGNVDNGIVITTHDTFSSDSFKNIIQQYKKEFKICLIADEVHSLGSPKRMEGLINSYDFRLALSATPTRWFDEIGTKKLIDFFDDIIFKFELKEAIWTINPETNETYLAPYNYYPYIVYLKEAELQEYIKITYSIVKNLERAKSEFEANEVLNRLYFKRADLIKNATNKYKKLEDILHDIKNELKWTIIYCSPQQIDRISNIVNRYHLIKHSFTMEEGVRPDPKFGGISQREYILNKFAEGEYQVLIAMKCLDEGVDIPPARIGILMASSSNPREYIQRIGRLIRRYPKKKAANIYDIIVMPDLRDIPTNLKNFVTNIIDVELNRCEEIAKIASNGAEAIKNIYFFKEKYIGV